jgi:NitT/TauT family transport system permease protein
VSGYARRLGLPLLVLTGLVLLWQALASGGSGVGDFPTPLDVARALGEQFHTPAGEKAPLIVKHVLASVFRTSFGFLAACLVGIPLGLAMGWYSRAFLALNPLIQILRPISPLAWIPIAILLLRAEDMRSVFIVFIATIFPITVATTSAVHTIPRVYLRAAQNFGLRGWRLFKKVVIPAALPQILIGLRLAIGIAWMVIVAAEMIAVSSGLGYLIIDARNMGLRYDLIVASMLVIGSIGLALDVMLRKLENLDQVKWGYSKRG